MPKIEPPPEPLAGATVALRPFRLDDAEAVAAACADPDIPRFTLMPDDMSVDDARAWAERGLAQWERGGARFAITLPPSDECVGQVGVGIDDHTRRAEAFYWVAPHARGRGVATEALDLVTRWAFEHFDVARAQLITNLDNAGSQRVAERAGYRREGVLRAWEPIGDDQPDVVMFSRLPADQPPR